MKEKLQLTLTALISRLIGTGPFCSCEWRTFCYVLLDVLLMRWECHHCYSGEDIWQPFALKALMQENKGDIVELLSFKPPYKLPFKKKLLFFRPVQTVISINISVFLTAKYELCHGLHFLFVLVKVVYILYCSIA